MTDTPRSIRLERRRLEDVLPYAANSKQHPQSQVEAIAASIRRFGFNDPIGITDAGVIVEGHGRLMAAQFLGMEEVPCLVLPADLTDEQADLYRIAHNKIALSSTFDYAELVNQLREISLDTATFGDMGFTQNAVDTLFNMFSGENAPVSGAVSATPGQGSGGILPTAGNNNSAGLDAEVIWDTKDDKEAFAKLFSGVCAAANGKTRGEALTAFLSKVMTGEIQPGEMAVASDAAAEDSLEWMP